MGNSYEYNSFENIFFSSELFVLVWTGLHYVGIHKWRHLRQFSYSLHLYQKKLPI